MIISKKKAALLTANYNERCRRYSIYNAPKLSITVVNSEGLIEAKNSTHKLLDVKVSSNLKINTHTCDPYMRYLINSGTQPFEID